MRPPARWNTNESRAHTTSKTTNAIRNLDKYMAISLGDREREGKTRYHGIATTGASNQETPREADGL
jgi:hypothetical protein